MIVYVTAYPSSNNSQKVEVDDVSSKRRYIFLLWMMNELTKENAGTVARCVDSKPSNARNAMKSCTVFAIMVTVRVMQAMIAQASDLS